MGADLQLRARSGCRRCEIAGAPLRGIEYELPVASAQVKSCLLFAGLLAEGETRVVEPLPSRDHTERMLAAAGADRAPRRRRAIGEPSDGTVTIAAGRAARARPIVVPADISSAAFFVVAGAARRRQRGR